MIDFEAMCVGCHGTPGKARAAVGQGLNPPAPDLQEVAQQRTPAELFWVTKHGIKMTGMPAWGASHDDDALWPVVALMTALPNLDASTYAEMLVTTKGQGHHADDANGHAHGDEAEEHAAHDEDASKSPDDAPAAEHDHSSHEH